MDNKGVWHGQYTGLVALLLIGLGARLTRLGHVPWYDETFNWYVSKDGVGEAIDRIGNDFFPPLYNSFLALWLKLVPAPDMVWLRLPSVAAGLVTLYIVYRLLSHLISARQALVAASLVALSPGLALWAQVVRPFAFELMFVALALYAGVRLVSAQGQAGLNRHHALLFTALLGAVYTNHGALFFTASFGGALMATMLRQSGWKVGRAHIVLALVFIGVALCWLPAFEGLLAQRARSAALNFPDHRPGVEALLNTLLGFVSLSYLWSLKLVSAGFIIPCAAFGARVLYRRAPDAGLTLLLLAAFFTGGLLLLYLYDPVFGRVLERGYWLNIIVLIFAGTGFAALLARLLGAPGACRLAVPVLAAMVAVLHAQALRNINASESADWRPVAEAVGAKVAPGDIAFTIPWIMAPHVDYYLGERFKAGAIKRTPDLFRYNTGNIPMLLEDMRDKTDAKRLWLFIAEGDSTALDGAAFEVTERIEAPGGALLVLALPLRAEAP
ncbi:glycosyltransferase family 39 protein [Kordiimonas sp.]|uniref:glycosyltransferase family 39 protein n=1 Tax=Kordiimonas sp. TaxID=1970157 RepID=UPI003A93818A